MRWKEITESKESLTLPTIEVGDEVLVGKFKNRKATVKGFTKDDHNQPVLKTNKGDQKLFKPRISKLMTESVTYPLADRGEWYGNANYADHGGRIVQMTPDEYLSKVRPLEIDDVSRDNIDDLKDHINNGRTLDPLVIYPNGKEDGRHRAWAAKELGIAKVPVIVFDQEIDEETVFHGSPHQFDRFSLAHVGAGEGNQQFGYGLYFTSKREIAEFYRNKLGHAKAVPMQNGHPYTPANEDEEVAVALCRGCSKYNTFAAQLKFQEEAQRDPSSRLRSRDRTIEALKSLIARGVEMTPPTGRLYKVELPSDNEYLLWDGKISEQPPKVRAVIDSIHTPVVDAWRENGAWEHIKGSQIYTVLAGGMTRGNREGQKAASEFLAQHGVAGIKYLDGVSRAHGDGSYNYVLFTDDLDVEHL